MIKSAANLASKFFALPYILVRYNNIIVYYYITFINYRSNRKICKLKQSCPTVPDEHQLDWECHPKFMNCSHNEHLSPPEDKNDTEINLDGSGNYTEEIVPILTQILNTFSKIDMLDPTQTILVPYILSLAEAELRKRRYEVCSN